MKKLFTLFATILLALISACAQAQNKAPVTDGKPEQANSNPASPMDATIVAPQAYRLQFENERLRVTRVLYKPHEIVATHEHPQLATVFLYLRDSGPVRFVHTVVEKGVIVRPAVKAGGFRLSRPVAETHGVENPNDQPSEFLRIELKNFTVDPATFRGRFPPDTPQSNAASEKIAFENQQIRIVRVTCAAQKACASTVQTTPYLLVGLTESQIKTAVDGAALSNQKLELGQTIWVEAGKQLQLENPGSAPVRFLRIELKAE
jgi:mannose-6-phosphate isomerase-like protein (cupin superfamily)